MEKSVSLSGSHKPITALPAAFAARSASGSSDNTAVYSIHEIIKRYSCLILSLFAGVRFRVLLTHRVYGHASDLLYAGRTVIVIYADTGDLIYRLLTFTYLPESGLSTIRLR